MDVKHSFDSRELQGPFVLDTGYNRGILCFTNLYGSFFTTNIPAQSVSSNLHAFASTGTYSKLRIDEITIAGMRYKGVLVDVLATTNRYPIEPPWLHWQCHVGKRLHYH